MRITYVRGGYYHHGRRGEKELISLLFSHLLKIEMGKWFCLTAILVGQGCHDNVPLTGGLKQYQFIV